MFLNGKFGNLVSNLNFLGSNFQTFINCSLLICSTVSRKSDGAI